MEINLKSDDIKHGMAKMAKAPVLLVGDIDRGGVSAQLIGTVAAEEDEKDGSEAPDQQIPWRQKPFWIP